MSSPGWKRSDRLFMMHYGLPAVVHHGRLPVVHYWLPMVHRRLSMVHHGLSVVRNRLTVVRNGLAMVHGLLTVKDWLTMMGDGMMSLHGVLMMHGLAVEGVGLVMYGLAVHGVDHLRHLALQVVDELLGLSPGMGLLVLMPLLLGKIVHSWLLMSG